MDREIDAAGDQRFLDLLREQALAAGFRKRPVLDAVARGADDGDRDGGGVEAVRGGDAVPRLVRLGEGEGRATRADDQDGGGSSGLHAIGSGC